MFGMLDCCHVREESQSRPIATELYRRISAHSPIPHPADFMLLNVVAATTRSTHSITTMALNLPKPVNSYAGEDDLKNVNGMSAAVEEVADEGEYRPPRMSDKYLKGIIYPPNEMRSEFKARRARS